MNFAEHTFKFTIGSTTVVIDGEKADMDTIPVLIGGVMFVPIRFILDRTGMEWTWNAETVSPSRCSCRGCQRCCTSFP